MEEKFFNNIRPYERQWVALKDHEVVAHDEDLMEAERKAKEKGVSDFTLFKVPSFRESFAPQHDAF